MLGPVVCDIVGTTLSGIEKRRIAHPLVGMVILFARNYEIGLNSKSFAGQFTISSRVF